MPEHDDSDGGRLFREAIGADRGEVRRLPATGLPPSPPRPAPAAKMAARDAQLARAEFRELAASAQPDGRLWRRDGVPPRLLEQLAHGAFAVQAEFRTDPRSRASVQRQITGFLHDCRARALGCVQIVLPIPAHGDDPATDNADPIERALEKRDAVIAYQAVRGSGALVLTALLAGRRA
ncbi:MAG: hypothetical protein K8F33_04865 [Thermomonas sp.]|uniref:hypothetical protein n=1 Tax=Thermomonas sp. TaxID=1971895 RepID=UPI001DB868FC|nr:hypothetical protein [Thermomonas sp.]MBZ0087409.1 hypothetical protein [Thermomonas sp.]